MLSNKNVLIISALLSFLIIVGISIKIILDYLKYKKLKDNTIFPPWPSICPDYWAVNDVSYNNLGEKQVKCKNIHKIGDCNIGDNEEDKIVDFNDPIFAGGQGPYYKCSWSRKCKAPWEGIDSLC